jgi:hypothetical protein
MPTGHKYFYAPRSVGIPGPWRNVRLIEARENVNNFIKENCQVSRKSGILAIGIRTRTPTQGWTPHRDPGEYTPTYLSLGELD